MNIDITSPRINLQRMVTLTIVCFCFIVIFMINVFPFRDGNQDLLDFGSFYASGLKIRNGENPYDADSEYVLKINFPRVGAGGEMINLNPPISTMAFGVIARFNPEQSLIVWQVISAILFTGLIFVLAATYRQYITPATFLWAFTIAGFWQTLTLGQIYVLLLLFIILGWVFVQRKRYILGGIAIGIAVAVKPNFIIWPIFLLVSGYAVPFIASVVSSLLISLIPVLFYGIQIYQQWLEASTLRIGTLILPGNSSLLGLAARLNHLTAGIVIGILLVCALLLLLRQRAPMGTEQVEQISALGIITSILVSPISWAGYTIFLLPIFFSLKKWTLPILISAAVLSFPFAFVLKLWQTSYLHFVIFGWFYGWGILSLFVAVVRNTMITRSIQTN